MSTRGASAPLRYRSIDRLDLCALSLEPFQGPDAERFIGPIEAIRAEVQRGTCHVLTLAEAEAGAEAGAGGQALGFFVTHPDRHDAACWWLGYLAVAPLACGRGLGHALLARAIRRLAATPGCSRIRLLVDPGNAVARRLYAGFGFTAVGMHPVTGELVLEREIDRGQQPHARRASMRRPSLRRRTAAERSPARSCAVWGTVLPGRAPPP